ncbi:MAG: hypothetical protein KC656_13580 [Myxococcales bacterium]|nr:hypothetical protein [Myxococcales bacterium]MCB9694919.1 hypothetical protein [Alphaproteobacteria bacterium]
MIIVLLGQAFASWVVEAPPTPERAEANALTKAARSTGHKGRVVRRFVDGEGWEYVVRWTFEGAEEANMAAMALQQATGAKLSVTGEDGAPAQDAAPSPEPEAEQRDWMAEALEAHGAGATVLAEASTVRVVFTRELADGRVAGHELIRRGTDHRLTITGKKGDVKESVTVAAGEKAWLVADGKASDQDLQRTREKLESFAPQSLAPLVLALDRAIKEHPELEEMVAKGTAKVGGVACEVAGSKDGSTLVAFGPNHLIRRLSVDGGKRVYEFSDYKEVGGVMIPHTIVRTVDENQRDTTRIEKVELDVEVDGAGFSPPG